MFDELKKMFSGLPKWAKIGLPLVVVGLVLYFVSGIFRNILSKLGVTKTPGEAAYQKNLETRQVKMVQGARVALKEQYQKQQSTKSDADWVLIARKIADDLHVKLEKDVDDATYQICRVQNDTDVYKLIDAFGEKSIYFFGVPYNTKNLPAFVNDELPDEKKAAINSNYSRKGIKFRY